MKEKNAKRFAGLSCTLMVGVLIASFIAVIFLFRNCSGHSYNRENADEAWSQSEDFVKAAFKGNGEVEFAGVKETKISKTGNVWNVHSSFYAENVFGGKSRQKYLCKMTYSSITDKWHLESLEFEQ